MAARFAVALLIAGASRAESQTRPDVPTSFGRAVCWLGDRDGDGFSDFAISEPTAWNEDGTYGAVWIYSANDVRPRARLAADSRDLWFGAQIDSSADLDGDGVRDLIVLADGMPPFFYLTSPGVPYTPNVVEVSAYSGCTLERMWKRTFVLPRRAWNPTMQVVGSGFVGVRSTAVLLTLCDRLALVSGDTGEDAAEIHAYGYDLRQIVVTESSSSRTTLLALVSLSPKDGARYPHHGVDRATPDTVVLEATSTALSTVRRLRTFDDTFDLQRTSLDALRADDLVYYKRGSAVGAMTTGGERLWESTPPEHEGEVSSLAITPDLDGDGYRDVIVGTHSAWFGRAQPRTAVRSGRTGEILQWLVPPHAAPRKAAHPFFGTATCFAPRFRAADDAVVLVSDAGIGEMTIHFPCTVLVYSLRDGRCIWRIQRPD